MNSPEIDDLINALKETEVAIKRADKLIETIGNEELKDYYNLRLLQMIDCYKFSSEILKEALEVFFDEEKKENFPANLYYRRVYKSIIQRA